MVVQEPFDRLTGAVLAPGAALATKGPSRQDSAPCFPPSGHHHLIWRVDHSLINILAHTPRRHEVVDPLYAFSKQDV
jgi:hypothetical protein